jgi:hypothetical protein
MNKLAIIAICLLFAGPALAQSVGELTWHSKGDVRCRDAIIKVTACAICANLHIFDGVIPSMESGDVLAASLRVAQSDGHPGGGSANLAGPVAYATAVDSDHAGAARASRAILGGRRLLTSRGTVRL